MPYIVETDKLNWDLVDAGAFPFLVSHRTLDFHLVGYRTLKDARSAVKTVMTELITDKEQLKVLVSNIDSYLCKMSVKDLEDVCGIIYDKDNVLLSIEKQA